MSNMRGLTMFISDIRSCSNKEAEEKRVLKELSRIRTKLSAPKKPTLGFDMKKYTWKLLYIHMLGYEVDFGHAESVSLISSSKHQDKYTGYVAASILLGEKSPELQLIVSAVRMDLLSGDEINQAMALATIGNMMGTFLTAEISNEVLSLVTNNTYRTSPEILKKALAVLIPMFRCNPTLIDPESWSERFATLLDSRSPGVVLAAAGLAMTVIGVQGSERYYRCLPVIVRSLHRLAVFREITNDYLYYGTPSPWLHIKLLKLLQQFPPPQEQRLMEELQEALLRVFNQTEVTKNVNKNNADHGILFEALHVVISYKAQASAELRSQCSSLVGRFISVKEPNIRYIGLECMSKLADHPDAGLLLQRHQATIIASLQDPDVSIRKRALDVLYAMCDEASALGVVEQLLIVLPDADYSLKEDLVLKTAIMAERFATDLNWYVDVVIQLITYAGDFVARDVWHRVVQVVTGFGETQSTELQKYAANKCFLALSSSHPHQNMVQLATCLLSEFGNLISNQPGKSLEAQFDLLAKQFPLASENTKAMLLSALMKLVVLQPPLKQQAIPLFETYSLYWDADIQQRAVEYLSMCTLLNDSTLGSLFESFPAFPEALQGKNFLLKRISQMGLRKTQAESPAKPVSVEPAKPLPEPVREPPAPAASVDLLSLDF